MSRRATLVVVVVLATIALTSESSFGETIQCRTSPGAPAPQGMHWYYRVDRTDNRHCWYMQAAGLPIHSQRNGMPSTTPYIAHERTSAGTTALSQLATGRADSTATDSTETLTPSVDQRATGFKVRWIDLPKSVI
jgi:hypothetical protein